MLFRAQFLNSKRPTYYASGKAVKSHLRPLSTENDDFAHKTSCIDRLIQTNPVSYNDNGIETT